VRRINGEEGGGLSLLHPPHKVETTKALITLFTQLSPSDEIPSLTMGKYKDWKHKFHHFSKMSWHYLALITFDLDFEREKKTSIMEWSNGIISFQAITFLGRIVSPAVN
jgi:hypothetical protein